MVTTVKTPFYLPSGFLIFNELSFPQFPNYARAHQALLLSDCNVCVQSSCSIQLSPVKANQSKVQCAPAQGSLPSRVQLTARASSYHAPSTCSF
jgi:hypothetical protein